MSSLSTVALAVGLFAFGGCIFSPLTILAGDFGPRLSEEATRSLTNSRFTPKKEIRYSVKQSEKTLTMGQAVQHALDVNPSLLGAEAQVKASGEARYSSLSAFGPKLSTSYGFSKQERETSAKNSVKLPDRGTYTWDVDITQNIFDGFSTLGTYQKKTLQKESDRASLRNSELSVVGSVQEEFISYLCSLENLASTKEALARLRDQVRIARGMHDVGVVPKLDVLQAETDLSQGMQSLISVENTRDTSSAKLNTLVGYPVSAKIQYTGGLHTPRFSKTLEQCLEIAYRLRPDIYISCKAVEIAIKDRLIARSGYYPKIEAYYGITKSGNSLTLERAGSNSVKSTVWEVGARVNWDVFQWGVTYFSDQEAGWLVAKKRSQVRSTLLNAGFEVKEKYLALREARQRIDVARKTQIHAREAYAAALAMYKEQTGTNFEVLDASSKLLQADVSLTTARGEYLTALSKLYIALGEFHPELL